MWHNGDVVQTQVPYDDWPITVIREHGQWRGVGIPDDLANGSPHTDAEVTEWVSGDEGIAFIRVRQDHQWEYAPSGQPGVLGEPVSCFLCGVKYADLSDDEKDEA